MLRVSADGTPLADHQILMRVSWKGKRGAITDWLTTDRDGRFSAIVAVGSLCRIELQGERRAVQEIEVTSPDDFEVTGLAAVAKD